MVALQTDCSLLTVLGPLMFIHIPEERRSRRVGPDPGSPGGTPGWVG